MTRRLLLVLLAPAGTLAAHGLAYWSQGDDGGLHDYLGLLGLPLVAALLLLWVIVSPRARRESLPSLGALTAAQLAMFAVQESVERLAHHVALGEVASELATSAAVRVGLLLQVVVALGVLLAVRVARLVVGGAATFRWSSRWHRRGGGASLAIVARSDFGSGRADVDDAGARGPPVVFVL